MRNSILLQLKCLWKTVIVLTLATSGCSSNFQSGEVKAERTPTTQASRNVVHVGGVSWVAPNGWIKGPERSMRVATYYIAAITGDAEDAECAIFYFGAGQGGTVQANVNRWFSQFEQPDGQPSSKIAKVNEQTINGLSVTFVNLPGTYLASGGPMARQKKAKPGFHMLAAIVDAPQGPVFFKLTGPSKTVLGIQGEFKGLLRTLEKN